MFEDLEKDKNIITATNIEPEDLDIDHGASQKPIDKSEISYEEKLGQFKDEYQLGEKNNKKPSKKGLIVFVVFLVLILIIFLIIFSKSIFNKISNPKTSEKTNNATTTDQILETTSTQSLPTAQEQSISSSDLIAQNPSVEFLDTDNDGLLDIYESDYGVNSSNSDSDGDRYQDGLEVLSGYDPNGPSKLKDDKNIFYFAYGSNMDFDTMKGRCGLGNFVGFKNSVLSNYSFYFYDRGVANVKPLLGDEVNGVLYKINQKCLNKLDLAEGYPNVYQREELNIRNSFGNYKAWIYIVENDDSTGNPSDSYLDSIISGAKEYGLPSAYIERIASLK